MELQEQCEQGGTLWWWWERSEGKGRRAKIHMSFHPSRTAKVVLKAGLKEAGVKATPHSDVDELLQVRARNLGG